MSDPLKKHTIKDLDRMYLDAEQVDKPLFAQMRSNLMLVAGDHYNKKLSTIFDRIRSSKKVEKRDKLRLTKNHIQRIIDIYKNELLDSDPSIGFEPNNPSEMQDRKAAQLHESVWREGAERNDFPDLREDFADSFFGNGEVAAKLFFDPDAGPFIPGAFFAQQNGKGEDLVDEETGELVPDESRPVRQGGIVIEELEPFNLLRAPNARRMQDSPYLIYRKMVETQELIKMFRNSIGGSEEELDEFLKKAKKGSERAFKVFDNATKEFRDVKENEVMMREYYFRPSMLYPEGYFYFTVEGHVLDEGPLPGGLFPIETENCRKTQSAPRGRSPIKDMRPFQIEINRAASKIAEHQVTLGDDKIMIQQGSKVSAGTSLPGVRTINYNGAKPEVLPGRDGAQYLQYMLATIEELYSVMNVAEYREEKDTAADAFALLFRRAKDKRKFSIYITKFNRFLLRIARLYLKLAKIHLPENAIIQAVGKNEIINMAEFFNSEDLGYLIKVVPQSDDIETKMGKQLTLNHALQFVGPNLSPEDVGKLLRQMPYANLEEDFSDLTLDYDSANNMILALDRGQNLPINEFDNHQYLSRRLIARMRQPDFFFLDAQIQQMYQAKIQELAQLAARLAQEAQAVKDGFIPAQGHLITVDLYVEDPEKPGKSKRARLPMDSIAWLIKKLEQQGLALAEIEKAGDGAIAQVARQMAQQRQGQLAAPAPDNVLNLQQPV